MPATNPAPQLVTVPREQFLLKEETRIRSEAARLLKPGPGISPDPQIRLHLDAVIILDDACELHATAIDKFRSQGNKPHFVELHTLTLAGLRQIRLHHLSQLASLCI